MRTVNNTGDPIVKPDGTILAGTKITFNLINQVDRKGVVWHRVSGELIAGETVVVTDDNGEFEVNLIPNDEVTPSTMYLCTIEGVGRFTATLEGGATPKKWVEFFRQQ